MMSYALNGLNLIIKLIGKIYKIRTFAKKYFTENEVALENELFDEISYVKRYITLDQIQD